MSLKAFQDTQEMFRRLMIFDQYRTCKNCDGKSKKLIQQFIIKLEPETLSQCSFRQRCGAGAEEPKLNCGSGFFLLSQTS
jgi:hypothetical protein